MWKQSVWTSTISSHLAALHLKPGGLLTLAGAKAALSGTGGKTHITVFTILITVNLLHRACRQGNRQTLIYRKPLCAYAVVVQHVNSNYRGDTKRCRALIGELTCSLEAWGESHAVHSSVGWKVSIKWIQETKWRWALWQRGFSGSRVCFINRKSMVRAPRALLVTLIGWLNPDLLSYFKILLNKAE